VGPSLLADVTFEAVVLVWGGAAANAHGAVPRALGRRIEALCAAGVDVFVVSDVPVEEVDAHLRARPTGRGQLFVFSPGGKGAAWITGRGRVELDPPVWVEEPLQADVGRDGDVGSSRSVVARFAARRLARRGVTGQLVLLVGSRFGQAPGRLEADAGLLVPELERAVAVSVGEEPAGVPEQVIDLGGGPARLLELIELQLERRRRRRVPSIDPDPRWVLELAVEGRRERLVESLGTLGNGWASTRGSREEKVEGRAPRFSVAGAYVGNSHLARGPIWTDLAWSQASPLPLDGERRVVDLRTGVLAREVASGFRSLRFVSAPHPHAMALRAEASAPPARDAEPVEDPGGVDFERIRYGDAWLGRCRFGEGAIVVAARDRWSAGHGDQPTTLERLAAWSAGHEGSLEKRALARLRASEAGGFEALLCAQRGAWARRWRDAEVSIEGGPEAAADELAARFAIFHLLQAAPDRGEAAVGARGLTGDAYDGHVFWDADVFVLPALAAIRPRGARAMLEYRVRRLPAARAAARARGCSGARFPWESAADGSDVTPRFVRGAHGERIPIATGLHEEHIVADVAWSAVHFATWTGESAFLRQGGGRDLVVETARYWASRIRQDRLGRGHLYGVMGPDEYHEVVDDNAYTNVMARWNLLRGAELLEQSKRRGDATEAARWRSLAASLVDGFDERSKLYEQFAGYFDLEPLEVARFATPPVAIDMLLGHKRVSHSQLLKQADVLMLHHLVPEEVEPASLGPCLDFYEPRTAHGSSLSPAISASLLARAGRSEQALERFRIAARLDLDDVTSTSAGGLHLATMGGVWQALAFGFLGLRAKPFGLAIDPRLPAAWSALSMRMRFRGRRVGIRATHDRVELSCDGPLVVCLAGQAPQRCVPPVVTFSI
jgi:trehalose/maltose hydrolase-like predicted phosphorylase